MSEPIPAPHTDAEFAAHVRAGIGEACLVCDRPLWGELTDYHGEHRCGCGATYQLFGCHLRDEWLAEHGLAKSDVAGRYCDCFAWVPLLRAYWSETKTRAPFGTYLCDPGRHVTDEQRTAFYTWAAQNEARLRPAWNEFFDWECLLARYFASFVGSGI